MVIVATWRAIISSSSQGAVFTRVALTFYSPVKVVLLGVIHVLELLLGNLHVHLVIAGHGGQYKMLLGRTGETWDKLEWRKECL